MLGVIFTGGESPDSLTISKLIKTEAPQSALLIAADSGFEAAYGAGLKPDWVIGDMDSIADPKQLESLPPERIIRAQRDKDFTDTEMAVSLAAEKGCDDFWIIGGGGGRIDHLFGIRSLFERDIFPLRWITDSADIRCINAGTESRARVCCELEAGAVVSVFPLGDGTWEAKSEGLKWALNGLSWDRGFFGLSNIAVDGKFSIMAEKGRFMVVLPKEI